MDGENEWERLSLDVNSPIGLTRRTIVKAKKKA